jgi:hypothetical protein
MKLPTDLPPVLRDFDMTSVKLRRIARYSNTIADVLDATSDIVPVTCSSSHVLWREDGRYVSVAWLHGEADDGLTERVYASAHGGGAEKFEEALGVDDVAGIVAFARKHLNRPALGDPSVDAFVAGLIQTANDPRYADVFAEAERLDREYGQDYEREAADFERVHGSEPSSWLRARKPQTR